MSNPNRDIALISLIPEFEATELRGNTYRQALADHGLPYDPALVRAGQIHKGGCDIYTTQEAPLAILGGAAAQVPLSAAKMKSPCACITQSASWAYGFLRTFQEIADSLRRQEARDARKPI